MEERHPIDQFFTDRLTQVDIPFDEGQWTALSTKLHARKSLPRLLWIGGGVAAAAIIAAILLFNGHHTVDNGQVVPTEPILAVQPGDSAAGNTSQAPAVTKALLPPMGEASLRSSIKTGVNPPVNPLKKSGDNLVPVQGLVPSAQPTPLASGIILSRNTSRMPTAISQTGGNETTGNQEPEQQETPLHRGWTLSIAAAPDLSGTRPLTGRFGGQVGLAATYRLTTKLSVTGGVFYGRKLYRADFGDYRPSVPWPNSQLTPSLVAADCAVLDIPLNLNFTFAHHRHSSWFASAGLSSYLMLRETYDYTYPPHTYGGAKEYTLRNQNRHIMGVGNVSIGYRRQLGAAMGITVQPFVKVPLTGIGNGNLKLYSSGVAISADIDLSRSNFR
ncbi:hypothetical protein [Parapedobacter lycopersici]|uniref:hypothetical protein n=1 Tax=Parapedobacter lycopersici TaxID=1864939 RepID=UPI00214D7477|nr:hypothetical protein [Parapedobacter lycopersici]